MNPVDAQPGAWMVSTEVAGTALWWAVRPLGRGQVEVWDRRAAPRVGRAADVRPRQWSVVRVVLDGDERGLVTGRTAGRLSEIGLPSARWYESLGDDPISAVVAVGLLLHGLVTFPFRIAAMRQMARVRNDLVQGLRD